MGGNRQYWSITVSGIVSYEEKLSFSLLYAVLSRQAIEKKSR